MLWESTEPRAALRQRFGLDSFDDAVDWLGKTLADSWAIDLTGCDRIMISDQNAIAWVRTGRGPLVAKWSRAQDQFGRLSVVADLLATLHRHGERVAAPLASVDGRHRETTGSDPLPLSIMVQPRIDGDLLDPADRAAVRQAGARLAHLHAALAANPDQRLFEPAESPDLRHRIETWLDGGDRGTVPAASARLRARIASLPPIDREPQLIHGDYRASNILTAGSEILAVLDFDSVHRDHCVSDLANVYLGTHFTDWRPTPADVRAALLDGYQSVRTLSRLEHDWLHAVTLWRGIMAVPPGDDPAGWAKAL